VPQFQVGELAAAGGGETGEPVPTEAGELQLGTGMPAFFTNDDPHRGRAAGQIEQAGQLGDLGAGPYLSGRVVGESPDSFG
jgi:hypothetical protein